jgi:predicted kinase
MDQIFYKFKEIADEYRLTPEWQVMVDTVEDSPWHRESNVAVHTEMVVQQWIDRFMHSSSDQTNKIALLALFFHDAGKPDAEEELERADGSGKYRRYAGHESVSSKAFMEFYLKCCKLNDWVTIAEARAIRWIIENHLPYGLKHKQKVTDLKLATIRVLEEVGCDIDTFYNCLRADAAGRISDDHATKLAAVEDWIANFDSVNISKDASETISTTMTLLVGPSGSGKSTYRAEFENDIVISDDDMKVSAYCEKFPNADGDIYSKAWEYWTIQEQNEYRKIRNGIINASVKKAVQENRNIIVDVVNASKKKRAEFVALAKHHKMHIKVVEFWVPLEVLIARQNTRDDKCVPASSVKSQYNAIGLAWVGSECHSVEVIPCFA